MSRQGFILLAFCLRCLFKCLFLPLSGSIKVLRHGHIKKKHFFTIYFDQETDDFVAFCSVPKTFRSQNAFAFCRGCYRSRELGGRLLRAPARGGCALWREDAGFPYSFLRTWKSPASLFTGRPDYGNDFSAAWDYASAAARSASVMTLEGRLRLVGSSLTYSLPARTSSTALACLAASQSLPTSFQL